MTRDEKVLFLNRILHGTVNSVVQYMGIASPFVPSYCEPKMAELAAMREAQAHTANQVVALIGELDGETHRDIPVPVARGVAVPLHHHGDARAERPGEQLDGGKTRIGAAITRRQVTRHLVMAHADVEGQALAPVDRDQVHCALRRPPTRRSPRGATSLPLSRPAPRSTP